MTAPVIPMAAPIAVCAPPPPIVPFNDPTAKPAIAITTPAMFHRTYDRCTKDLPYSVHFVAVKWRAAAE
jgi:hypothetical protein